MTRNSFVILVTVPANTLIDTKIVQAGNFSGILKTVRLNIPDGVNFAAGIRIVSQDKTLQMPAQYLDNSEKYYTGNNNPDLPQYPDITLDEEILEFWGINNDVNNSHTFVVTLEVEQ